MLCAGIFLILPFMKNLGSKSELDMKEEKCMFLIAFGILVFILDPLYCTMGLVKELQ